LTGNPGFTFEVTGKSSLTRNLKGEIGETPSNVEKERYNTSANIFCMVHQKKKNGVAGLGETQRKEKKNGRKTLKKLLRRQYTKANQIRKKEEKEKNRRRRLWLGE